MCSSLLGINLRLSTYEKNIVVQAIKEFIPFLKPGEIGQYKLALNKFLEKIIFTDGILMRCAENALRYKSKKADCKFSRLADNIQSQRETFQFEQMKRLII